MASLPDLSAVRANLAFTCVHEADHLPQLAPQADALFQYGRYLQKQDGDKNFNDIARYYRIATAHGHYKANHNLQLLVSQGFANSPDAAKETVDLAEQLIQQGIPGGYYDMGHYLELGYGVKQDAELSLRYFRKGADLGNPEAQAYVGEMLSPRDKAPEIARQMRQCALDQGYGDVASVLGIDLASSKLYPDAVKAFQKGAAAGDTLSALALNEGFKAPPSTDQLNYLALSNDPERARRYREIQLFLRENDGRNPKVPDIDKIVPLPPAKLPPWDGTFQWNKEQGATATPEKPSEDLIDTLSKEKNLDPATGLPLPKADKVSQAHPEPQVDPRLPIGTVARTGDPCPENGVWRVSLSKGMVADAERSFLKGMSLPSLTVYQPRSFEWLDRWMGVRQATVNVAWKLVGYIDQA